MLKIGTKIKLSTINLREQSDKSSRVYLGWCKFISRILYTFEPRNISIGDISKRNHPITRVIEILTSFIRESAMKYVRFVLEFTAPLKDEGIRAIIYNYYNIYNYSISTLPAIYYLISIVYLMYLLSNNI